MLQVKVVEFTNNNNNTNSNNKDNCFDAVSILLPSSKGPTFVDGKCKKVIIDLVPGSMKVFQKDMKMTEVPISKGIAYLDKNNVLYLLLK